jgi:hypothetical protein
MYLDHMKRRVKNNDTLLEVFAFLDRQECGRVSREDVHLFLSAYIYLHFCFIVLLILSILMCICSPNLSHVSTSTCIVFLPDI